MSIVEGVELKAFDVESEGFFQEVYDRDNVAMLVARALESRNGELVTMLRKHEFVSVHRFKFGKYPLTSRNNGSMM
jgi:hypothetical protein